MEIVKARMKKAAGADTTSTGDPDYSKMFLTMMHKLAATKEQKADSTGSKREYKGIPVGGDY
jgi:hypothetical protein